MQKGEHLPVLLEESVDAIPADAKRIIDCTLGLGGHAIRFLKKAEKAELLGIDQDESMLLRAKESFGPYASRVNLMVANFRELNAAATDIQWDWADVIFFDLGISSSQLNDPLRGLSFQVDGPLDMRLDSQQILTAGEIVNTWEEHSLADLFRSLGEEPFARSIARAIVRNRKKKALVTTLDLVMTIERAFPPKERYRRRVHFATNVFRALRMAVNDELAALKQTLPQAVDLLAPGGRLLVITFHSLEDRIVKRFLRDSFELAVETKKPISPSAAEIAANPRARSAKLRIAVKSNTG